jgi:hypothetical protein
VRKNILAIAFLAFSPLLFAQQALNNDSIIKLVKGGLSDDLIISTIQAKAGTYDTSTDGLIALKAAGVSDKVVAAMLAKDAAPPPAAPAPPPPAVAPPAAPAPPAGPSLPAGVDSVGLYSQGKDGGWQEVIAYDVTGPGAAIASFTKHMFKGNTSGQVEGETSRLKLALPAKFLLYVPEGVSPGEYQLVRFRIVKGNREFSLVARKPAPGSDSDALLRDTVDFDTKKIAPRLYQIDLAKDLGKGEYGLLPPGDNGPTGKGGSPEKIYTFSLSE